MRWTHCVEQLKFPIESTSAMAKSKSQFLSVFFFPHVSLAFIGIEKLSADLSEEVVL